MSAGYQLVVSADAGNTEDEAIQQATRALGRGGPVEQVRTSDHHELDRAIEATGDRVLVVAGGDGSLHVVLDRLWQRGRNELSYRQIGLVPLGTGNDFARGIGLPLEPAAAAAAIVDGEPHRFDIVVTEADEIVVNAVHIGVGADAAEVASGVKRFLGPFAYPVGALVAGLKGRGWAIEVEVDGRPLAESGSLVMMVGVANGPSIGGGTELCPPARPDDGRLDVVVVRRGGPIARASFARDLRRGRHLRRVDVTHQRGARVRISGEAVRHNADGELTAATDERTYELVPGAWTLIGPSRGKGRDPA